jgi:hypothetical protein
VRGCAVRRLTALGHDQGCRQRIERGRSQVHACSSVRQRIRCVVPALAASARGPSQSDLGEVGCPRTYRATSGGALPSREENRACCACIWWHSSPKCGNGNEGRNLHRVPTARSHERTGCRGRDFTLRAGARSCLIRYASSAPLERRLFNRVHAAIARLIRPSHTLTSTRLLAS